MTENKENNKKKDMRHREPNNQNVRCKSNSINDNVKCEWTKQSNQKEEIIRLDLENKNKIDPLLAKNTVSTVPVLYLISQWRAF